jgi:biotin operon repressor
MSKASQPDQRWLLSHFKALADENRLRLLGWLAQSEANVSELAARLELSEPTVSHHLTKLREVGLVMLRTSGNQRFYRANPTTLAQFKEAVQQIETLPAVTPTQSDDSWVNALPTTFDEQDRALLREMTHNGQLKRIPSKQLKLLVLLRWLALRFEPDRLYTEPEVNAIIQQVYPADHATLRRDLVDFGFLRRERGGGKYWLAPEDDGVPTGLVNPPPR